MASQPADAAGKRPERAASEQPSSPFAFPDGEPRYDAAAQRRYVARGYGLPSDMAIAVAPWGRRVAAGAVDALVTVAAMAPGLAVAFVTREDVPGWSGRYQTTNLGAALIIGGAVGVVAVTLWNRGVRQGRTGQTVGKQLLKIRLVSWETLQPIGVRRALDRDFGLGFDAYPVRGYWAARKDPWVQTNADQAAGTIVIQD